jgi:hypothetical protein
VPSAPSSLVNRGAAPPTGASTIPAATRIAVTVASSRSSFFGENGSIDGLMVARRDGGMTSQANDGREKTQTSAAWT